MVGEQDVSSVARSIDWPAVIAGAVGAAAISILLTTFGSAVGLSMTSARAYAGVSLTVLAVLAALWFAIVHISSFYVGGYVAGRMRLPITLSESEHQFRDGVHGFLVWALATLVGAYFLASAGTSAVSKAADAAGEAAKAAGIGVIAASNSSESGSTPSALTYYVDRMFRASPPAQPGAAAQPTQPLPRELNAEALRIITRAVGSDTLAADDRDYLARRIAAYTGLSEDQARERVNQAFTAAKAAADKARDAAESARRVGVMSGFLLAAVSLLGLVAAALGAGSGGHHRDRSIVPRVFGATRLW